MNGIATVRESGCPDVRMSTARGTTRAIMLFACLLGWVTGISAADDPYAAWGHGRPQDALPALHQQALASERWDAWFDLGLAALAAGRHGEGTAWLLAAHQRAPERPEPRQALRVAKVTVPPGWLDHLGPLAAPGTGWSGLVLLTLAGLALGYALCARHRRMWPAFAGTALLLAALPGRIAWEHDHARLLVATVHDSQLYDSSGRPIAAVAEGTVLEQESSQLWAERILVHAADGQRGHLPVADTIAKP